jgi:hypothetical protein
LSQVDCAVNHAELQNGWPQGFEEFRPWAAAFGFCVGR